MRLFELRCLTILGAAAALWPHIAFGQANRDYVFEDEDGHLVLRYVGVGHGELTATQIDEISNAEFSSMVHDRIRADLWFDAEPLDEVWARSTEPRIERYLSHNVPDSFSINLACRSASCRLVLEHSGNWTVSGHQALLQDIQPVIEGLILSHAPAFDEVFLITAYYQERETPHIKAFLQRTD